MGRKGQAKKGQVPKGKAKGAKNQPKGKAKGKAKGNSNTKVCALGCIRGIVSHDRLSQNIFPRFMTWRFGPMMVAVSPQVHVTEALKCGSDAVLRHHDPTNCSCVVDEEQKPPFRN